MNQGDLLGLLSSYRICNSMECFWQCGRYNQLQLLVYNGAQGSIKALDEKASISAGSCFSHRVAALSLLVCDPSSANVLHYARGRYPL